MPAAGKGPIALPGAAGAITQRSHHVTNQKVLDLLVSQELEQQRVLDVGAGEGYLVSLLGTYIWERFGLPPAQVLSACDIHPELFKYAEIRCDAIGPDGRLPYEAERFTAVTCVEVVEHLEDQFQLARELFRVTRPGGRVILTTPNVLNINSRLRYLHSRFLTLFDLLPLGRRDAVGLAGHVHPVGFYYLAHLLRQAGFRRLVVHFDFPKKSGVIFTALFFPFIQLWHLGFCRRMRRKYPDLSRESAPLLEEINSWGMLTSRTLIVEAFK